MEYEREFVKLSKYARKCVSSEAAMFKRFEDGLNEDIRDIRVFVGILELRQFVVLVERACKAEELVKERRKAAIESRDSRKRQMGKSHQSSSKKSKEFSTRSNASVGLYFGKFQRNERGCFKCGSLYHFIRDCPELDDKEKKHDVRASSALSRGRPQKNSESGATSRGVSKDTTVRSEGRVPTRIYAIRAHEEAESPDMFTGTFFYPWNICCYFN
ncbi:uncharacterized protein LOC128284928 [Gossypium arboreum]|uniref:uncharacterized protein LOC128284928 n=1 Tax=Gossypium arboreum TaxID=29729 RepID=UPI0022F172A1|nr:uncharacterized protein LOC128284928 [Gossypium arboreum]